MLFRIKKYVSLILLGVFLIPFPIKDWHDIEHEYDFHCKAKSEKHIHKLSHHCALCDLEFPISDTPENFDKPVPLLEYFYPVSINFEQPLLSNVRHIIFLRAPPVA